MATLTFVKNEEKYWEFIRNLRNLDGVRQGFIQQEHITEDQQKEYMSNYEECFYICLANDKPAGYVGVIDGDIRVATHPNIKERASAHICFKKRINYTPMPSRR